LDKLLSGKKQSAAEKFGSQVGRLLQKWKMGKLIQCKVKAGRLEYQVKDAACGKTQAL
jgi:hypothetical protein